MKFLLAFIIAFLVFPLTALPESLPCEEDCCRAYDAGPNTTSKSRVPKGFLRKSLGRKKWAEAILGRNLSVTEAEAIEEAPREWVRGFKDRRQEQHLFLIDDWNDKDKLLEQFDAIAKDFQVGFSQIKNE